jgi:hypothetical protein
MPLAGAVLKLIYPALIRVAEHWRIIDFEQRQLKKSATRSTKILLAATPPQPAQRSLLPRLVYPAITGLVPRP